MVFDEFERGYPRLTLSLLIIAREKRPMKAEKLAKDGRKIKDDDEEELAGLYALQSPIGVGRRSQGVATIAVDARAVNATRRMSASCGGSSG